MCFGSRFETRRPLDPHPLARRRGRPLGRCRPRPRSGGRASRRALGRRGLEEMRAIASASFSEPPTQIAQPWARASRRASPGSSPRARTRHRCQRAARPRSRATSPPPETRTGTGQMIRRRQDLPGELEPVRDRHEPGEVIRRRVGRREHRRDHPLLEHAPVRVRELAHRLRVATREPRRRPHGLLDVARPDERLPVRETRANWFSGHTYLAP